MKPSAPRLAILAAIFLLPAISTGEERAFTEEERGFWAFQPVREPALPAVKDPAWPQSPIDRFILAALEREGLHPAPPADRRSLIRRATWDLAGLPPAPEEVEAFLADDSPGAF